MKDGIFGTTVTCMDGRVQEPVLRWMRANFEIDYLDTITEPGADRVLLEATPALLEQLKQKLQVSTTAHGSRVVSIVGHHDCAGNPVSQETHLDQIQKGVKIVHLWNSNIRVVGLWVNEWWMVEKVADTQKE
jgi:hypothetical protein